MVPRKGTAEVVVIECQCLDATITCIDIGFRHWTLEVVVVQEQVSQANILFTQIGRKVSREFVVAQIHVEHLPQSHVGWNGACHLVAMNIEVACKKSQIASEKKRSKVIFIQFHYLRSWRMFCRTDPSSSGIDPDILLWLMWKCVKSKSFPILELMVPSN